MLSHYYNDLQTLDRYRTGPASEYLDEFITWLEELGFRYRSIRRIVRGASTFARWAQQPIEALNTEALCAFGKHLETDSYLQYPSGPYNHHYVSARHFIHFLEATGRVSLPAEPAADEPALWYAFCDWIQTQRGTMEVTLRNYRLTILALIQTLGNEPPQFNAKALREFVLDRAQQQSIESAKNTVTAVRMLVRFLIATGRCRPGLDHALPTIARWRLAALPKYLPAEEVERIIASCQLTTLIGVRDRAVLLLLARLGLRAGDVAALMFDHI
ncbi:MAG: site-specific integrase, partial [Ketobacter sp.]|nr:site-specific integrase [Ketobacter sp.]